MPSWQWLTLGSIAIGVIATKIIRAWWDATRRPCPNCGKRGVTSTFTTGADEDSVTQKFTVRHCGACGARHVECRRGIQRLPETNYASHARRYAMDRWARLQSRRELKKKGLCPKCNYDLRATPNRCPECGWQREEKQRKH